MTTTFTPDEKPAPKTVSEVFPLFGFVLQNIFQTLAAALTFVGILGYAAGKSFDEGWYRAAGTPPSLFPSDAYEFVLQGLSINTPWLYGAIALSLVIVIIGSVYVVSAWQEERNKLVRHRRKSYETFLSRRNRYKIVIAAAKDKLKGPAYQKWKALSSRGNWLKIKDDRIAKAARSYPYTKVIVSLGLQLTVIFIFGCFYLVAKSLVVDEAGSAGVREYIGIYAAITGRLPPQFEKQEKKMSSDELKAFACKGLDEIWKYRTINLINKSEKKTPIDDTSAYVLRGTDKFLFLLNSSGSNIRSFGTDVFDLQESRSRPISALVKSCP